MGTMTNIDFPALPDAEAARLMAERDGWRVEKRETGSWSIYGPKFQVHGYTDKEYAWWTVLQYTKYLYSLDAAVGWLGRMGLEWSRYQSDNPSVAVSTGIDKRPCIWHTCIESPTCPTSRALCNAGWAAVAAREAGK